MAFEFPLEIRLTHFFNFLFLSLLVRSGVEILGAHPKLYWTDHCTPGREWIRLTRKRMRADSLWTAEDEIQPLSSWVALPGRNNLGLGRHWHFWSVTGWILCGATYMAALFATSEWPRIVPASWAIIPDAWQALRTYTDLSIPARGNPYNPLQQLTYFLLIFGLAPIQILTGLAMSPALAGRFPRLFRIFGGHQGARSIHFIGLVAFTGFFVIHVSMVVAHGFGAEMARIVLGAEDRSHSLAIVIGLCGIAFVAALNVITTRSSLRQPARTKRLLELGIDPLRRLIFHHWHSKQSYELASPHPRINGRPPRNETYVRSLACGFEDWRLSVDGLVEKTLYLSVADLREMPFSAQSTLHVCIQGWTYFASWTGVRVAHLLHEARPKPAARYLVFHTLDEKWERPGHGYYYEVIDLETALKPQVILAYEMNGAPVPVEHGAPIRLRVEHQLGYKMAKWVNRIELVEDFRGIGGGQGGWRDDVLHYYPSSAGI